MVLPLVHEKQVSHPSTTPSLSYISRVTLLQWIPHFMGTLSLREKMSVVTSVHSYRFITVTYLPRDFFFGGEGKALWLKLFQGQGNPLLREMHASYLTNTRMPFVGSNSRTRFAFLHLTSHLKSSSWACTKQYIWTETHWFSSELMLAGRCASHSCWQQSHDGTSHVTVSTTQFHVSVALKAHSPALYLALGFRIFIPNEKKHWH